MRYKYKAIKYTAIFPVFILIIFGATAFVFYMGWKNGGWESGAVQAALFMMVPLDLAVVIIQWPVLIRTTYRVTFNELGVHCHGLFVKPVCILWENCKAMGWIFHAAGMYSFHSICFSASGSIPKISPKKGLKGFPKPSDQIICMAYNEFAWEEIMRYAPKRLYKKCYDASQRMIV